MGKIVIGIDLGTTYSMAAFVGSSGNQIVENEMATTIMPSIIAIEPDRILVGEEAATERLKNPQNCFSSFKSFMGRGISDFEARQQDLPFTIKKGENNSILMEADSQEFTPEQASAEILKKIKHAAENILQRTVSQAVITVPAYFDDAQRQATQNAATLAGLEVIRIINEPTAAAIAYGLDEKKKGKILVYDFGGGTLDVSILELKKKLFKTISTNGNTALGGDDIDRILMETIKSRLDILEKALDPYTRQYLKIIGESIKQALSVQLETESSFDLPNLNIQTKLRFTRQEFDDLIAPMLQKTMFHVEEALKDARLKPEEIDEVVLVGGSTKIPLVRKIIEDFFGQEPHIRINPDQAVALGAAAQAHLLSGGERKFLLMDIIPLSLGLETIGGTFSKLIIKNASIPARLTETFSTSKDNQTGVNINIYQGEREFVKDCRLIGKFTLKGIPPMLAGLPRIEVEFFIDANGVLSVSATELRSKTQAAIEIVPEHGLQKSVVNKMLSDSFIFAKEDFEARNLVEFTNKAENMLDGLRRSWEHADSFFTLEEKEKVIAAQKQLEETLQSKNLIALKKDSDALGNHIRDFADFLISHAAKQSLAEVFRE